MGNLAVGAFLKVIRETAQQARKLEREPGEADQDIECRLEMAVKTDGKKGVSVGGRLYTPELPVQGVAVGGEIDGGYDMTVDTTADSKIVLTYKIRLREERGA